MYNPEMVDDEKETVAVVLPKSMTEWIDANAAASGEKNRSAALRQMLRKLARLEAAEADGRLVVKKVK